MTVKLSENQVALILSYAPEQHFDTEFARNKTAREWDDAGGTRAEKLDRIMNNDVYDFEQIGWEIIHDTGRDRFVMAVVTPVPDYHEDDSEFDLAEITRQFVHDFKENMIDSVDETRASTGLRPRLFTAAMVSLDEDLEPGHEEYAQVANCMDYSVTGLKDVIEKANNEVAQAANLYDLTYGTESFC